MSMKRIKNAVLKLITFVAAITFGFSTCCFDSESLMPVIACAISATWLVLFIIANDLDGED